jgi:hypothetical protein
MADAHSPRATHKDHEQRAQHAAQMMGYGIALKNLYAVEAIPDHMKRLIDQLAQTDRREH